MDLRVETIFEEEMKGDTSFQFDSHDDGTLAGGIINGFASMSFYSQRFKVTDMRETWDMGIKHGIEIGLRRASIEGQRIELSHNTPEGKNKEFLEKFYKLAEEYNCEITYHPMHGMIAVDKGRRDF